MFVFNLLLLAVSESNYKTCRKHQKGENVNNTRQLYFLGPRGPLVLPLVECPSVCKKNLDHNIYRHTCLMNHQKTRLTSLMAPWDPLDALLDPLAPPGPPMNPLGPLNRSLGLIQTQDHLVCITNHQRTHQMSLPILWNILPFPLDPLGPRRPAP